MSLTHEQCEQRMTAAEAEGANEKRIEGRWYWVTTNDAEWWPVLYSNRFPSPRASKWVLIPLPHECSGSST